MSTSKNFLRFPIGVEYYRAPTPRAECWDGDFARLRADGFEIVRSHSYWNWMEPSPGQYVMDDFDRLFELAEKHGLFVWFDIMLATHGACPEWLTREYPDMKIVTYEGFTVQPFASPAYPQGGVIHCYDHPAWRKHGGALLQHVVSRYRDRPGLLIWGLWDSITPTWSWSPMTKGHPCYCPHSLAAYEKWLQSRFDLDSLNARIHRRYQSWADVTPPRSNNNVIEMRLFREFQYENLAGHLRWMVAEVETLDPSHEVRAHGRWYPQPWDELCAGEVDSWGMAMPSNNLLTTADPGKIAERFFSFDWSRGIGKGGRWWHEEIYAGMSPAGVTFQKQTDPKELTMLLWMTFAAGGAGAMFWQYRPEYLSFESPGYSLVAPDGNPTARYDAVIEAVASIASLRRHVPLAVADAEVGIVYHPGSHDQFLMGGEGSRYLADLRGVYRTLWEAGIATDVITCSMDWSKYRVVFLPNVALMDSGALDRITRTLAECPSVQLVLEGSFGLYSEDGLTSYAPPAGLADQFKVRVSDFSRVTADDLAHGRPLLRTPYGTGALSTECGYVVLEPLEGARAIGELSDSRGSHVVAVEACGGRVVWFGLTLSAGFADIGQADIVLGLVEAFGVRPSASIRNADSIVPVVRRAADGSRLLFLFNLGMEACDPYVRPGWELSEAWNARTGEKVTLIDGEFAVRVDQWDVVVIHDPAIATS